jgi:hypothetical protein
MDNDKRMPPGMQMAGQEDETDHGSGVTARAAEFADSAAQSVSGGYRRAKEKLAELDPRDTLRDAGRYAQETGSAAAETVGRHPVAAFAIGALSVGLLAYAFTGRRSSWQPDSGRWANLLRDYGDEAVQAGRSLLGAGRDHAEHGRDYLARSRDYLDTGRDYAREGGRMLVQRGEREPLAAVLGIGLALYALGSMFSGGSSASEPQQQRAAPKRRTTRR